MHKIFFINKDFFFEDVLTTINMEFNQSIQCGHFFPNTIYIKFYMVLEQIIMNI